MSRKSYFQESVHAVDGLDTTFGVVGEFADLKAAEPGLAARGDTVVVEEIPLAIIFDDAVVSGPAHNGCQDNSLIGEGPVGIVADCIAEEMAVAGGIREIILSIVFVHP